MHCKDENQESRETVDIIGGGWTLEKRADKGVGKGGVWEVQTLPIENQIYLYWTYFWVQISLSMFP